MPADHNIFRLPRWQRVKKYQMSCCHERVLDGSFVMNGSCVQSLQKRGNSHDFYCFLNLCGMLVEICYLTQFKVTYFCFLFKEKYREIIYKMQIKRGKEVHLITVESIGCQFVIYVFFSYLLLIFLKRIFLLEILVQ